MDLRLLLSYLVGSPQKVGRVKLTEGALFNLKSQCTLFCLKPVPEALFYVACL